MANEYAVVAKALVMSELKREGTIGSIEYSAPIEIIPETQASAEGEFLASAMPKAGDEITVTIDGEKHVRTAKAGAIWDGAFSVVYIGNCAEAGLPETEDNFGVTFFSANDISLFAVYDSGYFEGKETFTISATAITKTTVPIDPKFIPWDSAPGGGTGGGIPSIMLTTAPTGGDGATLTDEELAFFENLSRTETPMACVMFWMDENLYSALCTIYSDEEGEGYAGQTAVTFPGFDYMLARLVVDLGSGTVAILPLPAVSTNIG